MRQTLQELVSRRPAWLSWLAQCPEALVNADTEARRTIFLVQVPLLLAAVALLGALSMLSGPSVPLLRAWVAFAGGAAVLWPPTYLRLGIALWRGARDTAPSTRSRLRLYAAVWLFMGANGIVVVVGLLLLLSLATVADA